MQSGHASLLMFQTQQEQTVFIWQEVGKAAARVQKKNIGAKGYFVCTYYLKISAEKLNELSAKIVFPISISRNDM